MGRVKRREMKNGVQYQNIPGLGLGRGQRLAEAELGIQYWEPYITTSTYYWNIVRDSASAVNLP